MRRQNLRCIIVTFGRVINWHQPEWFTFTWSSFDISPDHNMTLATGAGLMLSPAKVPLTCVQYVTNSHWGHVSRVHTWIVTFSLALPACLMTSLEMLAVLVSAMVLCQCWQVARACVASLWSRQHNNPTETEPRRVRRSEDWERGLSLGAVTRRC